MKINEIITLLCISLVLSGCWQSLHEEELSGEIQGTTYHIKLVMDGASTSLEEVQGLVSSTLTDIDAQLSNYRENSEISRINRLERTNWLLVSKEIIELLSIANTVYERSDGCYDLTVKPLFDL